MRLTVEDFDFVVITTATDVGEKRLRKLIPQLQTEGIDFQVIRSEYQEEYTEKQMESALKRYGDKWMSPCAGAAGCATSHIKAARSTQKPVVVIEDDAVLAKQFKTRLQQEVLDFLPDDWACCLLGSSPGMGSIVTEVNPTIVKSSLLRYATVVLWRNNTVSRKMQTAVKCLVSHCYSDRWEVGFSMWADKHAKPLYGTRLWYAGQRAGISTTPSKGAYFRDRFEGASSTFGGNGVDVEIVDDGKIRIELVGQYINGVCNLQCEGCCALSQIQDWTKPVDEVIATYELALNRLSPRRVEIIGGEPLLHPNLIEIIEELYRASEPCQCKVQLITNGTLIPSYKYRNSLFGLAKKYDRFQLLISPHVPTPDTFNLLKRHSVHYRLNDWKFWDCGAGMIQSDKNVSFTKHPEWNNRCPSAGCRVVHNGRLYRCGRHASRHHLVQYGRKGGVPVGNKDYIDTVRQWDGISLTDVTPMEIRNYLVGWAFDECSLCTISKPFNRRQITEVEYQKLWEKFD